MVNTLYVGLGLSGLLFGPWIVYKALQRYRLLQTVDRLREGTHDTVEAVSGRVAGSVADDAVDGALTDDNAVLTAWKLEEWSETGKLSTWDPRGVGVWSVPFTLEADGATYEVTVGSRQRTMPGVWERLTSPSALTTYLSVSEFPSNGHLVDGLGTVFESFGVVERTDAGEDPPAHVRAFLDRLSDVGEETGSITNVIDIGRAHGERRFTERTVTPGDEVTVVGQVEQGQHHGHRRVTTPADEDGVVLVSPLSMDGISAATNAHVRVLGAIGGVMTAAGPVLLFVGI